MEKPSLWSRLFRTTPSPAPQTAPAKANDAADIADALQNSATGLGTNRDKRFYSDYGSIVPLSEFQLRAMYRGSWMAGAIVTTVAEDMTREWVNAEWTDAKEDDVSALVRTERRFCVKTKTREAVTWARVFGGSTITIGIKGQSLDTPLDLKTVTKDSLEYLRVRDRWWVYPDGLIDPNTEMPMFYRTRMTGVRIHASRIVRFEGRLTPFEDFLNNNFWHDSELQHVISAVKDFDGAVDNVSSMMWEAKIDVIKTALAKMMAAKDWAAIQERYQQAMLGKSNNKTLLLDKSEDYETKVMSFGGVHDLLGDYIIIACGAARIPMIKLFGQSAPGMNSTGDTDLRLYYDHIAAEAEWQMMPALERLYQVLVRDALGFMPDDFELEARPLWQIGEAGQATIDYQRAQTDDLNIRNKVVTPGLAAREAKMRGTYRAMTDDDVALAEAAKAPEPAAPFGAPAPGKAEPAPEPDPTNVTPEPEPAD